MAKSDDKKTICCSFCGKRQDQVHRMIAGMDGTFICDECVTLCSEIMEEEDDIAMPSDYAQEQGINLLKPKEIKEFLDQYDPDSKGSIVKCGMLVTDVSHKIQPNRFGVIKGERVEDSILIEFYIKHSEPLEIGSKIA